MKEGTVPVPPDRPCAERDDNVVPVQELNYPVQELYYFSKLSHSGEPKRRGWNPHECSCLKKHFSRAIFAFFWLGLLPYPAYLWRIAWLNSNCSVMSWSACELPDEKRRMCIQVFHRILWGTQYILNNFRKIRCFHQCQRAAGCLEICLFYHPYPKKTPFLRVGSMR